jgi:hypothetical protein
MITSLTNLPRLPTAMRLAIESVMLIVEMLAAFVPTSIFCARACSHGKM